jgi:hypothetical protein
MGKAAQVFTLVGLLGSFGAFTLAPEPPPKPEPPTFADNELQEQICETTCQWVGDQWICTTICY